MSVSEGLPALLRPRLFPGSPSIAVHGIHSTIYPTLFKLNLHMLYYDYTRLVQLLYVPMYAS